MSAANIAKRTITLGLALTFAIEPVLFAADSPPASDTAKSETDKWDVSIPAVPSDTIKFTTDEGTWISVDVHPDGTRLVFDLLGDIYILPIEGGNAKLISGGLAYEIQPRFSPDGSKILFTSDRGGGDNIWVMNADGSNRHAVTNETYRLLNNGSWHPDGNYIVARKHFTSNRSIGAGEMWLYRLDNGGKGIQLTKKKNKEQDAGEPVISPDGRFLYWSEDMSGGDTFEYNKDPNRTIYVIRRLDMETGEIRNVIRLPGGAVRPQISHDGKRLAFVRRVRTKSVLSLFDLESGEVRPLWDGLDKDQQETWAIFGVYPGFDWTPDGKALVIWAGGKLWNVNASTGQPTLIPFSARVKQVVARALRFPPDIMTDDFDVNVIRWPQISSSGDKVIFQALGYLWEQGLNGQNYRRLTKEKDVFEFAPAISPDGSKVIYVTWNDRTGGRVKSLNFGRRTPKVLIDKPGHYLSASFSPDGKSFVYHRGGGDSFRGKIWDEEPGIYLASTDRRTEPVMLTRKGKDPKFSKDGRRIFLRSRDGDKSALISVNLLGSDRRVHVTSERAVDFALSPDQNWLAFEELWHTYLIPFPRTSATISVGPEMKNLPVKKLSGDGGTYLSWTDDSRTISWSLGQQFFTADIDSLFPSKPIDKDTVESKDKTEDTTSILPTAMLGWKEKRDIPATDLYLVGGRILPMHDMSIIENGVIHIRNNLIAAVGSSDDIVLPSSATVIDVSGMTVMPGLVDIHSHVWSSNNSIYAQQNWALLANLAFGVTTIHDPSNNTQMIYAASELVNSGQIIGPRIFSTGTILYGAEGNFKTVINNYSDAVRAVKQRQAWGAISVKSYQQPRRNQRQMIIKAGHELGMMVVPEGGSTLHQNMTQLLDGHTTLEHSVPMANLYEPEMQLMSRFGTGYTPTLVVGYGGLSGERWWYQHTEIWKNKRLANFVPRSVIDPRSIRREMAPREEYHHFDLAAVAADVVHRGGNVQIGSHGQMQGLAAHWELWMFVQGGMTNHEALRAASWMGARAIGLDHQLGSVQVGMLADLIVINGDPLTDIYCSEDIAYTIINGRLYEAMTMNQLQPDNKPLPPGPFTDEVTGSGMGSQCINH